MSGFSRCHDFAVARNLKLEILFGICNDLGLQFLYAQIFVLKFFTPEFLTEKSATLKLLSSLISWAKLYLRTPRYIFGGLPSSPR